MVRNGCWGLALLVLSFCSLHAQVTNGTILGTVRDTSGAAVPDVQVTNTEITKNVAQTATTDMNGDYNVPFLNPGLYRVVVEKDGFARC